MAASGGVWKGGTFIPADMKGGARQVEQDMPGGMVRRAAANLQSVDVERVTKQVLPYGMDPRSAISNAYTGRMDVTSAETWASRVYTGAIYEAGAMRALGRSTPSPSQIRRHVARIFKLPATSVKMSRG